jgi:hypothetical protein
MIEEAKSLLHGMTVELRRDPIAAAIGVVPVVALGMLGDLGGKGMLPLSFFGASVTSFALHYILTRRAMRAGGLLATDAPGNVGGLFLLNLVSSLGISLGFILLIVPGVWLYARWIAAVPILFAEEMTPSQAMAVSASRTRPLLGPIILAVAILYVPFVAAFIASIALPEEVLVVTGVSLAINSGITISQVASWYMAIAAYRAIRPEPVAAVFA